MKEPLSSPPGSAALGVPIPHVPHALSVSLPTWQDNVGWAEGNARVVDAMSTGYPRFFVHRDIQNLAKVCLNFMGNKKDMALLFPTARTAEECSSYINRTMGSDTSHRVAQLIHFELRGGTEVTDCKEIAAEQVGLHAVVFLPDLWKTAKPFWQHTGMGISSRYANMVLKLLTDKKGLCVVGRPPYDALNLHPGATEEKLAIKHRISMLLNGAENGSNVGSLGIRAKPVEGDHVYLYPTGMSAIWHIHQLSLVFSPGCQSVCFGFSYTDSIKIYERWGLGSIVLFEEPDVNLEALEELLLRSSIAALFCEVPSNPLLQTPNMFRLHQLANKYGFLIIVDETIGNFVNVNILQYADILTTSMSKLFSGSANVMGGSVVINPNSRHFPFVSAYLGKTFVDDYYHEDAVVMEENSRDFASRAQIINGNAVSVCELLRARSLSFAGPGSSNPSPFHQEFVIKDIYYPKWVTRSNYDLCRRPGADDNFGPLFSLTFTSPSASHTFFDALECAKGPSLGTNFTLACPYTILAHYNERPWAASFGIEEGIVRISVGMEERDILLGWIESALCEAERTRQT